MPAVLYGEIVDAKRIELTSNAEDGYDIRDIQDRLKLCTANIEPDKEGRVFAPLSWVTLTQIVHSFPDADRFTWCPGPALSAWIFEEVIRRSCQGDLLGPQPARKPMDHQSAGAIAIGMNGRFLLADEPGCGKTQAVLMGLTELAARNRPSFPALVVCPAAVIDPWLEDIAAVYPEWRNKCFAYRGPNRQRLLKTVIDGKKPMILIMGYETMRIDIGETGRKSPLMDYGAKTVVFDECVPHDTPIKTPGGSRPISSLRKGDLVEGVDPDTGIRRWTVIGGVARSPLRPLVRIGYLSLTPNHPVWIADTSGNNVWYARSYEEGLRLRSLREDVYQGSLPKPTGAKVLLTGVHEDRARDTPGNGTSYEEVPALRGIVRELAERRAEVLFSELRQHGDDPGQEGSNASSHISGAAPSEYGEGKHVRGGARVPELQPEPVQGTRFGRYPHEGPCKTSCGWLADADGRKWHGTYYPAGAALEAARRGLHPRVLDRPVQGGPGTPGAEADNRGGRAVSPGEEAQSNGRDQGPEARLAWMDDPSFYEQGDPSRSLWNIETGTGNYVAAGTLTHNCHKLCNYQTKQSSRARRLAKHIPNVIGASGTPITSNAGNFWPIINGMFPADYPDRGRYKARYTLDKGQDYGFEIGGLDPLREPEFRLVMQGTMRRVAKSDVMKDLPPKTYQTRWVDIPDKWRAAYDEMEEDMIAHLPDAEHTTALTAMSTLAKMMRLRQLACSACDVEPYEELDTKVGSETYGEMIEKIKVTPRLPCWKGDALMELLEEYNQGYKPGERPGFKPVIAAAPYRQLITLCGGMAEKLGYKVGYIVGGMSDKLRTETRLAFQDNKLDLICVTTGAGGTGLTLTAADTVAFVARPWPYVEALQMEDRAHRRGQYKNVQIIDFETRRSIEARVREKLHEKAGNLAQLLQDPRIAMEFLGGQRKAHA